MPAHRGGGLWPAALQSGACAGAVGLSEGRVALSSRGCRGAVKLGHGSKVAGWGHGRQLEMTAVLEHVDAQCLPSFLLAWKRPCPCPQDRLWVWWGERAPALGCLVPPAVGCVPCALTSGCVTRVRRARCSVHLPAASLSRRGERLPPASSSRLLSCSLPKVSPAGCVSLGSQGRAACLPAVTPALAAHSPGPCTAGTRCEGSLQLAAAALATQALAGD